MVTFLLACTRSCAGTRDPPAPISGPGSVGVGITGIVVVTDVVVEEGFTNVFVLDTVVVVVVLDGTMVPFPDSALNVPETELYPKSTTSPLRSACVAFVHPPPTLTPPPPVVLFAKSRTTAPALVTWIVGESTLKVQVWFQALRSNWISPSRVFRLTMAEKELGLEEFSCGMGALVVRLSPPGGSKPTAAWILPLTLTTESWCRTMTDSRTMFEGVVDVDEIVRALILSD